MLIIYGILIFSFALRFGFSSKKIKEIWGIGDELVNC